MKLTHSDLLKGKVVKVMTDAKVEVLLTIESVEEKKHSRELVPATRENDWWPASQDWTTLLVKFTNGHIKEYRNLSEIEFTE